jgi:hypothetical protein
MDLRQVHVLAFVNRADIFDCFYSAFSSDKTKNHSLIIPEERLLGAQAEHSPQDILQME